MVSQQFLYAELTAMEKDLKDVLSIKPIRSCVDVHLEHPGSTSGTYTIDPNLGLSLDAVKGYCDFSGSSPMTCVHNTTEFSQVNYLHLLHNHVSQSIQLPCFSQGPFRYTYTHKYTIGLYRHCVTNE